MAALLLWATAKGSMGRHLPPPSVPGPTGYLSSTSPQQIRLSKTQYYLDWIAAFQIGFVKLSILFFYQRIFASSLLSRNAMTIATKIAIILTVIWTLAFGLAAIFRCGSTPHYIWTTLIFAGQHCGGHLYLLSILKASTISDFIMDILIWCLPIPKIWTLHMSTSRKVAISSVFLFGLITIGSSTARLAVYWKFIVRGIENSNGEKIITLYGFWTMIEGGLGLIVACIPSVRPLKGKSPAAVLSGIRSAFTLRSIRSKSSLERKWSGPSTDQQNLSAPNSLDIEHNRPKAAHIHGTTTTTHVMGGSQV